MIYVWLVRKLELCDADTDYPYPEQFLLTLGIYSSKVLADVALVSYAKDEEWKAYQRYIPSPMVQGSPTDARLARERRRALHTPMKGWWDDLYIVRRRIDQSIEEQLS